MSFRLRQLTKILRFLMFHVKHQQFTESNKLRISTRKFHLLAVFFLLGFCAFNLSSIETQAEEKLTISKVTINGDVMTEVSEGVYSGTVSGGPDLNLAIYSNGFETLTDYNLNATISFTHPQSISGSYLNITPQYHSKQKGQIYLAEIGKIYSNGNQLTYHTKQYYTDNQPNIPPFRHGGYLSPPFGGSSVSQNFETDLTYYFGENETVDFLGLLFQTGSPNSLGNFSTMQRQVTIKINYLSAVEKATIENAETTKNIFEWLQDGFVSLIVPTSDGIEDMLDNTSNTLESRLGILYMPIEFTGQLLGTLSASLENADTGQSITVPAWTISLPGHTYTMWEQFSFSINDNPIFQHITSNSVSVLLLRILYIVALFNAIFKTIDVLSDGMYDDEFIEIVTDNGEGAKL